MSKLIRTLACCGTFYCGMIVIHAWIRNQGGLKVDFFALIFIAGMATNQLTLEEKK